MIYVLDANSSCLQNCHNAWQARIPFLLRLGHQGIDSILLGLGQFGDVLKSLIVGRLKAVGRDPLEEPGVG